jgi:hypothetical protein
MYCRGGPDGPAEASSKTGFICWLRSEECEEVCIGNSGNVRHVTFSEQVLYV